MLLAPKNVIGVTPLTTNDEDNIDYWEVMKTGKIGGFLVPPVDAVTNTFRHHHRYIGGGSEDSNLGHLESPESLSVSSFRSRIF